MILNDRNIKVIPSKEAIFVLRKNTAVSYKLPDFTKESSVFDSKLYRTIDGVIYGYSNGVVVRHGSADEIECGVGPVIEFVRVDGMFYFVKSKVNRMALVNQENRQISEFSRVFCLFGRYLYYAESVENIGEESYEGVAYEIIRLDVITSEVYKIGTVNGNIIQMTAYHTEDGVDLVALADCHNNLHIVNDGRRITYKWSSNKILDVVLTEEYAIIVSKDGRVAKFSVVRDERVFLFEYHGEFTDMCVFDGKLYFLSNVYFLVYDLGMDQMVYEDVLPRPSSYSLVAVDGAVDSQSTDIFKRKKESRMEIFNSLNIHFDESSPLIGERENIGFVNGDIMFLLGSHGLRSQFILNSETNFISGNKLISVVYKKTKIILQVYSIFVDKLVFLYKREIHKVALDAVYSGISEMYIRNGNGLFFVNDMGILEQVHDTDILEVCDLYGLKVLNSRGLFDVDTRKYICKQKQILKFCICGETLLFYVKDRGLYLYSLENASERILLGVFNGLIDLSKSEDMDCFYVLSNANNQKILGLYRLEKNEAILVEESVIEGCCTGILTKWAFVTQGKQILTN
ncbi:hypothetical protein PAEPH01_0796 [Pancytospora epiphaga]|nr:hypothetical protein PAEPH01_0796 [Pancytospora epiphaga]